VFLSGCRVFFFFFFFFSQKNFFLTKKTHFPIQQPQYASNPDDFSTKMSAVSVSIDWYDIHRHQPTTHAVAAPASAAIRASTAARFRTRVPTGPISPPSIRPPWPGEKNHVLLRGK
jgi:hypothetical protein